MASRYRRLTRHTISLFNVVKMIRAVENTPDTENAEIAYMASQISFKYPVLPVVLGFLVERFELQSSLIQDY